MSKSIASQTTGELLNGFMKRTTEIIFDHSVVVFRKNSPIAERNNKPVQAVVFVERPISHNYEDRHDYSSRVKLRRLVAAELGLGLAQVRAQA